MHLGCIRKEKTIQCFTDLHGSVVWLHAPDLREYGEYKSNLGDAYQKSMVGRALYFRVALEGSVCIMWLP